MKGKLYNDQCAKPRSQQRIHQRAHARKMMIEKPEISQQLNRVDKPKALVILAHGAGADMEHEYITTLTCLLNEQQFDVLRFNFPYMDKRKLDGKKRPPDKMPTLMACYQSIIAGIDNRSPVFIAGKSMGGRVAAMLASNKSFMSNHNVKGVICLGYPFHPIKKTENLRLTPLQETQLPVLILQGERDALGSKCEIEHYQLSPQCQLHYFEDGDHDLKPRVKSGFTLQAHKKLAVAKMKEFIHEYS